MGRLAAGPIYEFNPYHAMAFTVGSYQNDTGHYAQLNWAYRYSHWQFERPGVLWRPLQIGLFAIYSTDQDRYFIKSPDKYPMSGYYDETALRGGLEFGSTIILHKYHLGLAMYLRILDNGIVAIVNNRHRDLQYYSSTGLALQYVFW